MNQYQLLLTWRESVWKTFKGKSEIKPRLQRLDWSEWDRVQFFFFCTLWCLKEMSVQFIEGTPVDGRDLFLRRYLMAWNSNNRMRMPLVEKLNSFDVLKKRKSKSCLWSITDRAQCQRGSKRLRRQPKEINPVFQETSSNKLCFKF